MSRGCLILDCVLRRKPSALPLVSALTIVCPGARAAKPSVKAPLTTAAVPPPSYSTFHTTSSATMSSVGLSPTTREDHLGGSSSAPAGPQALQPRSSFESLLSDVPDDDAASFLTDSIHSGRSEAVSPVSIQFSLGAGDGVCASATAAPSPRSTLSQRAPGGGGSVSLDDVDADSAVAASLATPATRYQHLSAVVPRRQSGHGTPTTTPLWASDRGRRRSLVPDDVASQCDTDRSVDDAAAASESLLVRPGHSHVRTAAVSVTPSRSASGRFVEPAVGVLSEERLHALSSSLSPYGASFPADFAGGRVLALHASGADDSSSDDNQVSSDSSLEISLT